VLPDGQPSDGVEGRATGQVKRGKESNVIELSNIALPARWRAAYRAALALLESDQPYSDPSDPVTRARVQRLRTDTRRWIREQKLLASAGVLPPVQSFFIAQIPDNWREIDLRRRQRRRS
jgi:hypothetical protein